MRVVKIGGSVSTERGASAKLKSLLRDICMESPTVVVAGGGKAARWVRSLDSSLTAADSHRLAIEAMGLYAKMLSALSGVVLKSEPSEGSAMGNATEDSSTDGSPSKANSASGNSTGSGFHKGSSASGNSARSDFPSYICPSYIWKPAIPKGLPASWDVTSDSIALWLARKLKAERLYLVKAAEPPYGSLAQLRQRKIIDCYFHKLLEPHIDPPIRIFVAHQSIEDATEVFWQASPQQAANPQQANPHPQQQAANPQRTQHKAAG